MSDNKLYKKDIVRLYSKQNKIPLREAERRIEDIFEIINANLVKGYDIKLNGFFNFYIQNLREKKALNPITKEPMTIKETRSVHVRMSASLKQRIQGKVKNYD